MLLVIDKATVDVSIDNYEKGITGDIISTYDFSVIGLYKSWQDLVSKISTNSFSIFSDDLDDYILDKLDSSEYGLLTTSGTSNKKAEEPSKKDYEDWENGKSDLLNHDLWLKVYEVDLKQPRGWE